ncbi:MAG: metallophosphoesterase [Magnetococcales bacterium]|nr:metallophosphoesterase [Magnetococcales bacterium]
MSNTTKAPVSPSVWSLLRLKMERVARRFLALPDDNGPTDPDHTSYREPQQEHDDVALAGELSLPRTSEEQPTIALRMVVFSDTDNDTETVRYALWLLGVCDRQGSWRDHVRHITIVHTGDWLNKFNPDPHALDFFKKLQQSAPPTCRVIMLNGNHELELLRRSESVETLLLTPSDLEFIRNQNIIYIEQNTLFVHGYPNLELLTCLRQLWKENVPLNHFNDRFRKAFFQGEMALFRLREGLEMLGDLADDSQFYNQCTAEGLTNGEKVSNLLLSLGIHIVVHGHKPNNSVQLDDELGDEVPGVRFINNDNRVKRTGLGGVLLLDNMTRVEFLNMKRLQEAGDERNYRKKLRKLIGTRKKDQSSEDMEP